eukprot:11878177-Alexandrium_andersonii.AAC.1
MPTSSTPQLALRKTADSLSARALGPGNKWTQRSRGTGGASPGACRSARRLRPGRRCKYFCLQRGPPSLPLAAALVAGEPGVRCPHLDLLGGSGAALDRARAVAEDAQARAVLGAE